MQLLAHSRASRFESVSTWQGGHISGRVGRAIWCVVFHVGLLETTAGPRARLVQWVLSSSPSHYLGKADNIFNKAMTWPFCTFHGPPSPPSPHPLMLLLSSLLLPKPTRVFRSSVRTTVELAAASNCRDNGDCAACLERSPIVGGSFGLRVRASTATPSLASPSRPSTRSARCHW